MRFQFTPLREGRRGTGSGKLKQLIFQFTPLREGRHNGQAVQRVHRKYFNSRPSARGDGDIARQQNGNQFQFTPLREGRPAIPKIFRHLYYFNSRPSARGDRREGIIGGRIRHFNSRPSARGDLIPASGFRPVTPFQFTPLREGRLSCITQNAK